MRRYFKTSVLTTIFLMVSLGSSAQLRELDTLMKRFDRYRQSSLQEKLFVHLDQDYYLTGEIMWYRIYAVDAAVHKPLDVSKVAYMEILDVSGKPVAQSKVKLKGGAGSGSFFIPAILASGKYTVRFYTQWMRNFPVEYFFHKAITIVNPFVRVETSAAPLVRPSIAFFPEGGNLIEGVRNRIGFRVSAGSDSVRAVVLKDDADTVAVLKPVKFGLGSFYLMPQHNAQYKVVIKTSKGSVFTQDLPRPSREGFAMLVYDSAEKFVKVRVHRAGDRNIQDHVYFFAHARQVVVKSEVRMLASGVAEFTIDKGGLPDGVSHFTVFDSNLKPVCERLYFTRPRKEMKLDLAVPQTTYAPRREVKLNISAKTEANSVASANVSVSVVKLDSALNNSTKAGIHHYLYLTSDLNGEVESPEFYFSDDAQAASAADNLMLTHGWRRFNWDNVIAEKSSTFVHVPEVRNHLVTGTVTRPDGTPVSGVMTYLSSPGKLINVYGSRSDENGIVRFEVRDFWETRKLIMQTNTNVDSTYSIAVNEAFEPKAASFEVGPLKIDRSMETALTRRSTSMQVQDIYYRERADRVRSSKVDSTAFYGQPDEIYYLDDYTRFPVMEEVMREYVPGVLVRKRKGGFHFIVLDRVNKGVLSGDPLVLLDGVPVFDVDRIMEFDPRKVKKLEVVTRNFFSGPLFLPGVVSYSTYSGDLAGFELDPRSVSINYEGLQLHREFYAPEYESQKDRGSRLPDQRHMLHWQPLLSVVDGKASTRFFTSDVQGTYVIIVHGLGTDGSAGSGTATFEVKRTNF